MPSDTSIFEVSEAIINGGAFELGGHQEVRIRRDTLEADELLDHTMLDEVLLSRSTSLNDYYLSRQP